MDSHSAASRSSLLAVALALAAGAACSSDEGGGAGPSTAADAGADASGGTGGAPPDAAADATAPEGGPAGVTPAPEGAPWETLAEWNLFTDPVAQIPAPRVVPFEVIAPLFTDYAEKRRFIHVPEGAKITYRSAGVWDFPVGAILVKTFSYLTDARDRSKGERLLETRLLVHEPGGWTARTYVWNEAQTEARLERAGLVLATAFIDPSGNPVTNDYLVPGENDCRACHGKGDTTNTLGGKTLQLDRSHDYGAGPVNQIEHLAALGFFAAAPPPAAERTRLVDPFGTAPIFDRVRSYFDGNCAHCHQPGDLPGSLSGFWLDFASTDGSTNPPTTWGICKQPTSAGGATCGRQLDVVPGAPDDSVLLCRLEATEPKVRMPPLGRTLVHAEGVELIREWVGGLRGGCGAPGGDAGNGGDGGDAGGEGDAGGGADAAPRDAGPG